MTVLIVDDYDPFILAVTELLLDRNTAEEPVVVCEAAHCDEALQRVDQEAIDCILMDQKLLGGVSGVGCIQEIRDRGYRGAIVMLTGYAQDALLARQAAGAGVDGFLHKDKVIESLLPTIDKAIAARRQLVQVETAARTKQEEMERLLAEMDALAAKVKAHLARK